MLRSKVNLDSKPPKVTLMVMTNTPCPISAPRSGKLWLALIACVFSMTAAEGHEFWIDPLSFSVPPGASVVADIRVGEEYQGAAYSYLPKNFRQFSLVQADDATPVDGRLGDRPALNQAAAGEGLTVIVHETSDNRLTYSELAKFERFVTHKDALWTLKTHAAKGFPESGFVEIYSRYAKSLVAVGHGEGRDRPLGLLTEIVAEANPYTDDLSQGLTVALYYQEKPRSDAQIEVFEKAGDGTVNVFLIRTDAEGRAVVPVKPDHRYMLDAVVLREPEKAGNEDDNVVWESLWANLTFEVPG